MLDDSIRYYYLYHPDTYYRWYPYSGIISGIRNPLPLSDHTTVSFRSLQMTVLLIPFLPTGKIGPTKIPLTPVISEMLHRLHDSIRNHQLIQHLVILRSPPWCYVSFSSAGRVIESGDVDTFCPGVGKSGLDRLASRSDSIRPVDCRRQSRWGRGSCQLRPRIIWLVQLVQWACHILINCINNIEVKTRTVHSCTGFLGHRCYSHRGIAEYTIP